MLLSNLKTSFLFDSLNLYLIVPLGILGSVLNLISLLILFNKSIRCIGLFKYLQIYTLNSFIICTSEVGFFMLTPNIFYDLSISYAARFYKCFVLTSIVFATCFFYGNVLEIFINIERALNYTKYYERFNRIISPYSVCLIVLIICILITAPNYFLLGIVQNDELFTKLALCENTNFTNSSIGKIVLITDYTIQGPLVLALIILSSCWTIRMFKKYMIHKERTETIANNANKDEIKQRKKQRKLEIMNQNMLVMTFNLNLLSIICHIFQIPIQIIILFVKRDEFFVPFFIFLFSFIMVIKHLVNIFFYYRFSSRFRKNLNNFFNVKFNKN